MSTQAELNLDSILQQKEQFIIPENIRQGVTALGVTGTLKPEDLTKLLNGFGVLKTITFSNDAINALATDYATRLSNMDAGNIIATTLRFLNDAYPNSTGLPKYTINVFDTKPYIIYTDVPDTNNGEYTNYRYVFFNTTFTNVFIQVDQYLSTGIITSWLNNHPNETIESLRQLSGWYREDPTGVSDNYTLTKYNSIPVITNPYIYDAYSQTLESMLSGGDTEFLRLLELSDVSNCIVFTEYTDLEKTTDEFYNIHNVIANKIRGAMPSTTATASDVRAGIRAVINDGSVITGTLPKKTASGIDGFNGTATDSSVGPISSTIRGTIFSGESTSEVIVDKDAIFSLTTTSSSLASAGNLKSAQLIYTPFNNRPFGVIPGHPAIITDVSQLPTGGFPYSICMHANDNKTPTKLYNLYMCYPSYNTVQTPGTPKQGYPIIDENGTIDFGIAYIMTQNQKSIGFNVKVYKSTGNQRDVYVKILKPMPDDTANGILYDISSLKFVDSKGEHDDIVIDLSNKSNFHWKNSYQRIDINEGFTMTTYVSDAVYTSILNMDGFALNADIAFEGDEVWRPLTFTNTVIGSDYEQAVDAAELILGTSNQYGITFTDSVTDLFITKSGTSYNYTSNSSTSYTAVLPDGTYTITCTYNGSTKTFTKELDGTELNFTLDVTENQSGE